VVFYVFMLFCILVSERAILSWCPKTWHNYIVYNILSLNISSIYIDYFRLTEAPRWRKVAVIFCGLALQFVSVGLGFGLSVMYPVLIDRFQTKRSDAALIQGLYMGMSTGGGNIVFFTLYYNVISWLHYQWYNHINIYLHY